MRDKQLPIDETNIDEVRKYWEKDEDVVTVFKFNNWPIVVTYQPFDNYYKLIRYYMAARLWNMNVLIRSENLEEVVSYLGDNFELVVRHREN